MDNNTKKDIDTLKTIKPQNPKTPKPLLFIVNIIYKMEEPQDLQKKRLTFDNLKFLEKILKASLSSAEIIVEGVDDPDALHLEIFNEFENIFKRIKNLVGETNFNRLTGLQQALDARQPKEEAKGPAAAATDDGLGAAAAAEKGNFTADVAMRKCEEIQVQMLHPYFKQSEKMIAVRYQGETLNGRPDGYGTITYVHGNNKASIYSFYGVAEFRENKINGKAFLMGGAKYVSISEYEGGIR